MDTSILEEMGLSHAEARIYLTLLETGSSKTGPIIDLTGLQSSTVYHVLGSLIEKGFVSYIFKGKIKYYQAENPESFLVFLEEKKGRFLSILQELKHKEAMRQGKQTAKVYEGVRGLKTAFNDILDTLSPGEEYYFFQVPTETLSKETAMRFLRTWHLRREASGIRVKGLALTENRKPMKRIFSGIKLTQLRYSDELLPNALIVYKNKVITLTWGKAPACFVIQSEAVAESYKRFFEQKWEKSKP